MTIRVTLSHVFQHVFLGAAGSIMGGVYMTLRASIVTVSDKGFRGERHDLSGPAVKDFVESLGGDVVSMDIAPDEQSVIADLLETIADCGKADIIFTTGGTGMTPRDVTPEATEAVIQKRVPGIPEAMRAVNMERVPMAMLSRATAGIRGRTLIINLPGSPKAVKENLEVIRGVVQHMVETLRGTAGDCGRAID